MNVFTWIKELRANYLRWKYRRASGKKRKKLKIPDEILNPRQPLGAAGERVARWYLETEAGLVFVDKNFRYAFSPQNHRTAGELDLVMRYSDARETLVFVEVRTRSYQTPGYGTPTASVNLKKRTRVCRAAKRWLEVNEIPLTRHVRFDIVSIIWEEGQMPEIKHFPNAFPWTDPLHSKSPKVWRGYRT